MQSGQLASGPATMHKRELLMARPAAGNFRQLPWPSHIASPGSPERQGEVTVLCDYVGQVQH